MHLQRGFYVNLILSVNNERKLNSNRVKLNTFGPQQERTDLTAKC